MKKFFVGYPVRHYFSFGTHPAFGTRPGAWMKILRQNSLSIHPYFIPKALMLSSAMVVFSPFRWYEQLRYGRYIRDGKVKDPVFIIGHPRSGTTFLHYLMSRDPAFGYCTTIQALLPHTFLSSSSLFSGLIARALPDTRPMDNMKMGTDMPMEEEFALAAYGPESLVTGYYFPKNFLKNLKQNVIFQDNLKASDNWKKHLDHFLRMGP